MKTAETKKRVIDLIERINATDAANLLSFEQQDVVKKHLSVIGSIGRLCVTPVSSGNDISLSGKELEKEMTPFMEQLCGRQCDGYKQRNKNKGFNKQPYWRVKDFNLVEKAIVKYSSLGSYDFRSYLLSIGQSQKTAKNYVVAVERSISKWAQEAGLITNSLISIESLAELNAVIDDIKQLVIFKERNEKGKGMYSAALKHYAQYLDYLTGQTISGDINQILTDDTISTTEKSALINTRIGQGKFRENLIRHWGCCAITGFRDPRFLVASHIKPWKAANNRERLDKFNGILLLPNLDKTFDLGYISFDQKGKILISKELEEFEKLGIKPNMQVNLEKEHQPYLKYHRERIFEKLIDYVKAAN